MNPTITPIIISTLVLISCATKAAELPSSKASKDVGPVLTLKPEPKCPRSISIILGAQRAGKEYKKQKFAAILRKEFKTKKKQFRRELLGVDDLLETCCKFVEETRKMVAERLSKLEDVKKRLDRIDKLRQRSNGLGHKTYVQAKRQRRD